MQSAAAQIPSGQIRRHSANAHPPGLQAGGVQRAQVNILGERYIIRGDAQPDYIAEVADLVDSRMRALRDAASAPMSKTRLAVLAAVNLADELLQTRGGSGNEELERRTRQLITLLDEGLIGDET